MWAEKLVVLSKTLDMVNGLLHLPRLAYRRRMVARVAKRIRTSSPVDPGSEMSRKFFRVQ